MRANKIDPFSVVTKEEIQEADEQEAGKHAITAQAKIEGKDVGITQPLSANDVKQLWKNWRAKRKVKKEK